MFAFWHRGLHTLHLCLVDTNISVCCTKAMWSLVVCTTSNMVVHYIAWT